MNNINVLEIKEIFGEIYPKGLGAEVTVDSKIELKIDGEESELYIQRKIEEENSVWEFRFLNTKEKTLKFNDLSDVERQILIESVTQSKFGEKLDKESKVVGQRFLNELEKDEPNLDM